MAKNRLTTPKGRAIYPRLNSPDTKFDPEGVYKITLGIPADDGGDKLAAEITKLHTAAVAQAKKDNPKAKKFKVNDPPFVRNDETGEIEFTFKMKAQGKNAKGEHWERKPPIFDAKGTPLKDAKIGGGSVCKVSFTHQGYYTGSIGAGLALYLEAVQVLELKSFGGSAESYGFGEEEGFEASEEQEDASEGDSAAEEEEEEEGAEEDEGDDSSDGSDF